MPVRSPLVRRYFNNSLHQMWRNSTLWCHRLIGLPGVRELPVTPRRPFHGMAPLKRVPRSGGGKRVGRNRHQQYRLSCQVRQLDGICRISGTERADCDAAHIVPLCAHTNYDVDNAILLTKTLHNAFDRHQWCFDVLGEILPLPGYAGWCYVHVALAPGLADNNMIRMYATIQATGARQWFAVRTECLAALCVRQKVCHELWQKSGQEGGAGRGMFKTVVEIYRRHLGGLFEGRK